MARFFRTPMLVAISIGLSAVICLIEELRLTGCGYATLRPSLLDVTRLLEKLVIPVALLILFQSVVAFTNFAVSDQPRLPGRLAKGFGTLFVAIGGFILFQQTTQPAALLCTPAYWGGVVGSDSLAFLSLLWFVLWFGLTVVCIVANAFVPQGKSDV